MVPTYVEGPFSVHMIDGRCSPASTPAWFERQPLRQSDELEQQPRRQSDELAPAASPHCAGWWSARPRGRRNGALAASGHPAPARATTPPPPAFRTPAAIRFLRPPPRRPPCASRRGSRRPASLWPTTAAALSSRRRAPRAVPANATPRSLLASSTNPCMSFRIHESDRLDWHYAARAVTPQRICRPCAPPSPTPSLFKKLHPPCPSPAPVDIAHRSGPLTSCTEARTTSPVPAREGAAGGTTCVQTLLSTPREGG